MQRVLKTCFFALLLFLLIFIGGLIVRKIIAQPKSKSYEYSERGGTAVVITGAAARIAQEAALLETLHKNGWFSNICFISGTSSGALNTVMLNSILEKKFSWKRYNSILYNIKDQDIYTRDGRSLPVNNEPFQNLLRNIINDSLGYYCIGDLPVQSSISISAVDLLPPFSKTSRLSQL